MSRWSLMFAGLILGSGCSETEPFVPEQPPTSAAIVRIDIAIARATLELGDTVDAVATAYSTDGAALDLVSFEWSSSDSTIATVAPGVPSSGAAVSAVGVGTTSLLATAGGLSSDALVVTIIEPEPPAQSGDPQG